MPCICYIDRHGRNIWVSITNYVHCLFFKHFCVFYRFIFGTLDVEDDTQSHKRFRDDRASTLPLGSVRLHFYEIYREKKNKSDFAIIQKCMIERWV